MMFTNGAQGEGSILKIINTIYLCGPKCAKTIPFYIDSLCILQRLGVPSLSIDSLCILPRQGVSPLLYWQPMIIIIVNALFFYGDHVIYKCDFQRALYVYCQNRECPPFILTAYVYCQYRECPPPLPPWPAIHHTNYYHDWGWYTCVEGLVIPQCYN